MEKKKLFNFACGNPPYMENTDSQSTRMPPIYNVFMDEVYKIAEKTELITPARFLFNAGYTPKEWNEKMLKDPHFKVLHYEPDSSKVFPDAEIKGGVAITYRDSTKEFGAIGTFTKYEELNTILKKVMSIAYQYLDSIISSPLNYTLSSLMKAENPNLLDRLRTSAFTNLAAIFYEEKPTDGHEYVSMIGLLKNKRVSRYVRRDYLKDGNGVIDKYNLLVSKANGSGYFGETLSQAVVAAPGTAYTQTFIGIGAFKTKMEVENTEKYIKTKFARAMLGVLKITQDCPGPKWKYVPLQDFTEGSDIDWSKSITEIDAQLYRKYGLTIDEINFIEENVKEME